MTTVDSSWFETAFARVPVMAILRGAGVERSIALAETAWDLGIDAVEVTLQSPDDLDALRQVARLGAARGKVVGAGTIVTAEQLAPARAAGASYLVSPGFDRELVVAATRLGLPSLPGVATPGEVQAAHALGLTWVKAFPAAWLGPAWFTLLRGPFPDIRFVATGGLHAGNAAEFLDAGVRVVAVGSALEDPAQLTALSALLPPT